MFSIQNVSVLQIVFSNLTLSAIHRNTVTLSSERARRSNPALFVTISFLFNCVDLPYFSLSIKLLKRMKHSY